VVGAVAAGFFLILFLGLHEATYAAGILNLLIAAVALLLDRRVGAGSPHGGDSVPEESPAREAGPSPGTVRLALWAAGISGFCALALQVLWTRSLVYFLDNSTHAFTTILAAFLLGIGVGSLLVARFVDGRRRLLFLLGTVQVLIGLSALLAIPVLGILTPTVERMAGGIAGPLLTWRWIGARFLTSLAVMLVPTVLMGVAFPLVTRIYAGGGARIGTVLGNIYSVNTVGGVFGSFAAGFVLIPLLGLNDAIVFTAVLSVGIGSLVLYSERDMRPGVRKAAVLVAALAVLSPGAYLLFRRDPPLASYYERMETSEILSYEEGLGATVKVFRDARGDKLLSIDGFPVAGTTLGMHDAQQSLAQIPLLLTGVPSPTVNIVGFGTGGTSWGILQHGVTRIDCVELVPGVIHAAPYFPEVNHGVLDHPDFRVILGDGRNYVLMSRETYDVISIDATSPKMAGNGSLYALEFYQLLRARLSPEGLAVQWLPIHLLSDSEVRMTARTFQTVFPHSTLWLSPLRRHGILVGSVQPVEIDFSSVQRKLEKDGVREELARFNVRDAYDFLSWFVMGEESLAQYVDGALLNTDRHPYLEFSPARAFFQAQEFQVRNLARLRDHRESVLSLLTNLGETQEAVDSVSERIQRRFEATQHSIAGDIFLSLGRRGEARIEYNRARAIDPDDKNWMNPAWEAQAPAGDPGRRP
jgi:spermidine synthase